MAVCLRIALLLLSISSTLASQDLVAMCPRKPNWCSHSGAVFELKDCDADGIPDPTCKDSSSFGVIQSSKGCADSWPNGECESSACRTPTWCTHSGATYQELDCDGDCVNDPICSDIFGNFGILSSAENCKDTWPKGSCKAKARPGPPPTTPAPTPAKVVVKEFPGWCQDAKGNLLLFNFMGGQFSRKEWCLTECKRRREKGCAFRSANKWCGDTFEGSEEVVKGDGQSGWTCWKLS